MIRPRHTLAPIVIAALLTALTSATNALAAAPGSFDTAFGSSGTVSLPSGAQAYGVAVEPSGDIVVAGVNGGDVFAELLSSSGSVLGHYTGPAGAAQAVAIAPDGDVVLAGQSGGAMLVEDLDSTLSTVNWKDLAFAGDSAFATSVTVTSGGSPVVGGEANDATAVAQFSSSGALSWTQTGFANSTNGSQVNGVAAQPNGDVVAVGEQRGLRLTGALVAQLSSAGKLLSASTFGYPNSGYTILTSAAAQPDGDVVAGGLTEQPYALAIRVTESGAIDGSFGSSPASGYPSIAALPSGQDVQEPDFPFGAYGIGIGGGGTVLAIGNFEDTGAASDQALYAFTSSGQADSALTGGDGSGSAGTGVVVGPDETYEGCGIAVDPSSGDVIAAGDTVTSFPVENPCDLHQTTGSSADQGFVSRLIGFGPPPAGTGPSGAEPAVSTGGASAVSESAATLSGTVNPEGLATTYHFQYGTSSSYGSSTTSESAGAGTAAAAVSAKLSGLSAGKTYHYRLVASNADGTAYGAGKTFTTPKTSTPKLKIRLGKLSKKYSDGTVTANGIKLKVTCSESCSFTATLTISKATAEKAKLGDKALVLGTVSSTGKANKAKKVTLKLSQTGKTELGNHTLAATITVTGKHSGSPNASTHAKLTLSG